MAHDGADGCRSCSGYEWVVNGRLVVVVGYGRSKQGIVRLYDKRERIEAGGGAGDVRSRRAVAGRAGRGLENANIRDPGIVTRHGDVYTVFESELDGVLEGNFQLALMNELLNAGRIGERARRHLYSRVGSKDVWEGPWGARVTILGGAKGKGLRRSARFGLRRWRRRRILRSALRIRRGSGSTHKRHSKNCS